jgi:hypothetical protein
MEIAFTYICAVFENTLLILFDIPYRQEFVFIFVKGEIYLIFE